MLSDGSVDRLDALTPERIMPVPPAPTTSPPPLDASTWRDFADRMAVHMDHVLTKAMETGTDRLSTATSDGSPMQPVSGLVTDQLSLSTPALLFPAVSLLLLAYTNRFLNMAAIIRGLSDRFNENHDPRLVPQIANLRKRIDLIRYMQETGVVSLLLCFVCMICLFLGFSLTAHVLFAISVGLMIVSLGFSVWEIQISTGALKIHLAAMEEYLADEARRKAEARRPDYQQSAQASAKETVSIRPLKQVEDDVNRGP